MSRRIHSGFKIKGLVFMMAMILIGLFSCSRLKSETLADDRFATNVTPPNAPDLYRPDFSSQNNKVVVNGHDRRRPIDGQLYIIDLETNSLHQITQNASDAYDRPKLSPKGDKIVMGQSPYYPTGIWVVNSDGSDLHFISEGYVAEWSPSGSELAIASVQARDSSQLSEGRITIVDMDTGEEEVVFSTKAYVPLFYEVTWSPTGQFIAFSIELFPSTLVNSKTEFYLLDFEDNSVRQLLGENHPYGGMSWLTNPERLIHLSGRYETNTEWGFVTEFHIHDLEGNCSRTTLPGNIGEYALSSDNARIVYAGARDKIYILDIYETFDEGFWDRGVPCE